MYSHLTQEYKLKNFSKKNLSSGSRFRGNFNPKNKYTAAVVIMKCKKKLKLKILELYNPEKAHMLNPSQKINFFFNTLW